MSDRIDDIRKGFMILLPVLDEKGRAVIYANPALMGDKVEEVSRTTIFMFIFLCKLKDSSFIDNDTSPYHLGTPGVLVFSSCCK